MDKKFITAQEARAIAQNRSSIEVIFFEIKRGCY